MTTCTRCLGDITKGQFITFIYGKPFHIACAEIEKPKSNLMATRGGDNGNTQRRNEWGFPIDVPKK